jgi:hypothetical protein
MCKALASIPAPQIKSKQTNKQKDYILYDSMFMKCPEQANP